MNPRYHPGAAPKKKAGVRMPADPGLPNNSGEHPCPPRSRLALWAGGCHPFSGVMQKRLPPYLKRHADRLQKNPGHPVSIFIGPNAWEAVKRAYVGCVCPLDEDPALFHWSALRMFLVFIHEAGHVADETVHALGLELLRAGIPVVTFLGEEHRVEGEPRIWIYTARTEAWS